jgi:hypothetical protein
MEGPGDTLIGVQVKRYRGKILAEEIREFTGALVLQRLDAWNIRHDVVVYSRGVARVLYVGSEDSNSLYRDAHLDCIRYKRVWL